MSGTRSITRTLRKRCQNGQFLERKKRTVLETLKIVLDLKLTLQTKIIHEKSSLLFFITGE
jgi:hypothetical protein